MPLDTERRLYAPCRSWLQVALQAQHPRSTVVVLPDTDRRKLGQVLEAAEYSDRFPESSAWNVRVDVVAVIERRRLCSLAFVELKSRPITLVDVGQLLGYCRVCKPELALLLSPSGVSAELSRLLNGFGRTDILTFERNTIVVGKWDVRRSMPDWQHLTPPGLFPRLSVRPDSKC